LNEHTASPRGGETTASRWRSVHGGADRKAANYWRSYAIGQLVEAARISPKRIDLRRVGDAITEFVEPIVDPRGSAARIDDEVGALLVRTTGRGLYVDSDHSVVVFSD
jgi:hypothetical protein